MMFIPRGLRRTFVAGFFLLSADARNNSPPAPDGGVYQEQYKAEQQEINMNQSQGAASTSIHQEGYSIPPAGQQDASFDEYQGYHDAARYADHAAMHGEVDQGAANNAYYNYNQAGAANTLPLYQYDLNGQPILAQAVYQPDKNNVLEPCYEYFYDKDGIPITDQKNAAGETIQLWQLDHQGQPIPAQAMYQLGADGALQKATGIWKMPMTAGTPGYDPYGHPLPQVQYDHLGKPRDAYGRASDDPNYNQPPPLDQFGRPLDAFGRASNDPHYGHHHAHGVEHAPNDPHAQQAFQPIQPTQEQLHALDAIALQHSFSVWMGEQVGPKFYQNWAFDSQGGQIPENGIFVIGEKPSETGGFWARNRFTSEEFSIEFELGTTPAMQPGEDSFFMVGGGLGLWIVDAPTIEDVLKDRSSINYGFKTAFKGAGVVFGRDPYAAGGVHFQCLQSDGTREVFGLQDFKETASYDLNQLRLVTLSKTRRGPLIVEVKDRPNHMHRLCQIDIPFHFDGGYIGVSGFSGYSGGYTLPVEVLQIDTHNMDRLHLDFGDSEYQEIAGHLDPTAPYSSQGDQTAALNHLSQLLQKYMEKHTPALRLDLHDLQALDKKLERLESDAALLKAEFKFVSAKDDLDSTKAKIADLKTLMKVGTYEDSAKHDMVGERMTRMQHGAGLAAKDEHTLHESVQTMEQKINTQAQMGHIQNLYMVGIMIGAMVVFGVLVGRTMAYYERKHLLNL